MPPRRKPKKVFISYSHKDEKYKNELVTMLKGLGNRRAFTTWQDQNIGPGDEWEKTIKEAMEDSQAALLLVSQHFLVSRFIQGKELPKLLKQRIKKGLIVIPIIIRPCLWNKDPILKKLQALPQNARPITNARGPNERATIWVEVAVAIEDRLK